MPTHVGNYQLSIFTPANDEIVRLDNFGAFQISLGSEGAETESKFNASLIKTKKVTFRPGADLREMLNNLKFEKA